MDERARLHRYKSTSHGALVGVALIGGLYFYYQFARGEIHYELVAILAAMAVTKVSARLYYKYRD